MIVLASKSASRRTMLGSAGVEFEIRAPAVDERALEAALAHAGPGEIALALAEAKALSVDGGGKPVLGSDSVVAVGGRRFSKPASRAQAVEHLQYFSGKTMELHSAAAIAHNETIRWHTVAKATLKVRELSDAFIDRYLAQEWPEVSQCVGVFRIEALGPQLFESIEGDMLPCSACPCWRCSGRCASWRSCRREPAVRRGHRRPDRTVEVAGDPRVLARAARHRGRLPRSACPQRGAGRLPGRAQGRPGLARLQRDDAAQAGSHAISRPTRPVGYARRRGEHDRARDRRHAGWLQYRRGRVPEPLRATLARRHLFRMARVVGTGGAARAIVAGLAAENFVVVLAGRDQAKAQALLDELDPGGEHHTVDLAHFADPTVFAFDDRAGCLDLIVNASPLGMAGQPPLAFDFSHVPPGSVVYDIVTHPADTPLLQAARAAGFPTIDGLSMLIGQAAVAFEKFFGQPPPREVGDRELRALLAA
jgi:predicted house-cleaning NTP pyrophosphatase (Maf/HAM1 superfamily)